MVLSEEFIKYVNKKIIIDTNRLLLLLIGNYDEANGSNFLKNFKEYSKEDYEILKKFISQLNIKIVITPHILSEISDMINNEIKPENNFEKVIEWLSKVSNVLKEIQENDVEKNIILDEDVVKKLGFTDTSIIITSRENGLPVLTGDIKLSGECNKKRLDVISYDVVKSMGMGFY
jgi:hypothetical protein